MNHRMTATSVFESVSVAIEESRLELVSGVVIGELITEGEMVAGETGAGESKYTGLKEEPLAGQKAREVDAEDQVAAMEAANSAAAGASELVVGRKTTSALQTSAGR